MSLYSYPYSDGGSLNSNFPKSKSPKLKPPKHEKSVCCFAAVHSSFAL